MAAIRQADPLPKALKLIRDHESYNGDSWGWAVARSGEIEIKTGLGVAPSELSELPVGEAALAHTRAATRGSITKANAHPFPVKRGTETVAALAHNGTWLEAPEIGTWSDSKVMAHKLSEWLTADPELEFSDALKQLGELTGETLLALHRGGTIWVYAGRFDITRDGHQVASSGFELLDDGLHRVGPKTGTDIERLHLQ